MQNLGRSAGALVATSIVASPVLACNSTQSPAIEFVAPAYPAQPAILFRSTPGIALLVTVCARRPNVRVTLSGYYVDIPVSQCRTVVASGLKALSINGPAQPGPHGTYCVAAVLNTPPMPQLETDMY